MHPALRLFPAAALLLAATLVRGQDKPSLRPSTDAELWLSGAVELRFDEDLQKRKKRAKDREKEKELGKEPTAEEAEKARKNEEKIKELERSFWSKFRVSGELGYRGNENLTSSKLVYTVLGARYRFHKYLRLTLEHRYNFRDRFSVNTHRLDVQLDSDKNFGRWNVGYRFIYQHEFVVPIRYRDIVRNRGKLTYRTRNFDIDPYASIESFGVLHYTGNALIGMRYGLGAEWDLPNGQTIDASIRYDREQNIPEMQYRWIFGVAYEFQTSK